MHETPNRTEQEHAEQVAREQQLAERERILAAAAAEGQARATDLGATPLLNPADHPQAARDYIASAFALAGTDPDVAMVVSRALPVLLMDLVVERAATDDAFAQRVAQVLVQASTLPTTPGVPRGRQGVARRG